MTDLFEFTTIRTLGQHLTRRYSGSDVFVRRPTTSAESARSFREASHSEKVQFVIALLIDSTLTRRRCHSRYVRATILESTIVQMTF